MSSRAVPGEPHRSLARLASSATGLVVAVPAVGLIGLLLYTTSSRIAFPYELEWLEGWTVDSIRRVLSGRPLFVAPSAEWVPYIYTPLYTYLSALVAKVTGISFLAPRLVSLAAALGCLMLTASLVRRETGSGLAGLGAAGFLAGTYELSGTWFDVARVDTLFLFFVLAAVRVLRSPPSMLTSAVAGLFMGLAYLTKQTALLPLAALSLFTLSELSGKQRFVLALVGGLVIGVTTLTFSATSGGWYYYYTVEVPAMHGFGQEQMLVGYWLDDLGLRLLPAGLLGLLYLASELRERSERFVLYSTLTVAMIGASWTSRLHGGGWLNVLQPAHAMLAVLLGLACGRLGEPSRTSISLAASVRVAAALQLALLFYNPARHIPGPEDVANGDALVAYLKSVEGEVYTPMHGFLPTLAGKEVFAIDGYLLTIVRTGDVDVVNRLLAQFHEAFSQRRFAAVVVDFEDYRFMDLLREHYRFERELPGSFRPRRGPLGVPQKVFVPKLPPVQTERE